MLQAFFFFISRFVSAVFQEHQVDRMRRKMGRGERDGVEIIMNDGKLFLTFISRSGNKWETSEPAAYNYHTFFMFIFLFHFQVIDLKCLKFLKTFHSCTWAVSFLVCVWMREVKLEIWTLIAVRRIWVSTWAPEIIDFIFKSKNFKLSWYFMMVWFTLSSIHLSSLGTSSRVLFVSQLATSFKIYLKLA